MSNICIGYLVKLKGSVRFWKRKGSAPYYPLRTAIFRVFREEYSQYLGRLFWIESMDKTAEACIKEREMLKLSPLEQLALQAAND